MERAEWEELVTEACQGRPAHVVAHTYLKSWQTSSRPVLLSCDDGNDYVVKGRQAGRMLVNDQVVGLIGLAMGAPVGEVALVEVPPALIDQQPEMQHIPAGSAHGCRLVRDSTEQEPIGHTTEPENRDRFAHLAVLYGLVVASDHQFIYANATPRLVYSVDHGHFFPSGPEWTTASLAGAAAPAPDATLVGSCALTTEELRRPTSHLKTLSEEQFGEVVSAPTDEWGLSSAERVDLAIYLASRRDDFPEVQDEDGEDEDDGN